MSKIKTKNAVNNTIKTINKDVVAMQKMKDSIVNIKEKSENATKSKELDSTEYATNKIIDGTRKIVNNSRKIKKLGDTTLRISNHKIINNQSEKKLNIKTRLTEKNEKEIPQKKIKTNSEVVKNTQKVANETLKTSQKAMQLAKESAKKMVQEIKTTVKATISAVKGIIAGTKALISALVAGGGIAVIVIIIICLVGLLCSSIFGIFFSGEKTSANGITMKEVIAECNQEFTDKIQSIQNSNNYEEYVLDGNLAPWKDVLLIYTIKISNGVNEQDVITIDDNKKATFKQIFWDMNKISSKVKKETIIERGVNETEKPKEVQKKVLHIKITNKTIEEMKNQYNFSIDQNKQLEELASDKYASLWNGAIYGLQETGDFINWRQRDPSWSNVKIGNTSSTIGDIGCLVTSIAILIQKSGVDTGNIIPFNPGTFVEALNNNGGFDNNGNLKYAAVSKVVPNFKYEGNVNLRKKTKEEKLALISQYYNQGYYLTAEVKGASPGNQHWVAIIGINDKNIVMVDPATNHTDMWNAYEFSKTSQFNYFKVIS